MEHLEGVPHGNWTLEAPYLSEKPFNFEGDWKDYPTDQKFPLEAINYRQWSKFPISRLAPFLQNWLFFGLLRAVLPKEIDLVVDDFVRTDKDDRKYITTINLRRYLKDWIRIQGKLPLPEKWEISKRNEAIFDEARQLTFLLTAHTAAATYGMFPPLPFSCALSCALLGQALALTNLLLQDEVDQKFLGPWTTGHLLREQLELQGWCPFLVNGISQEMNTIHYISTLGGPKVKRSHRKCSEDACLAVKIEGAQHTAYCSGCALVGPSIADIVQAIHQDATPILQYFKADSTRKDSLKTGVRRKSSRYMAISHVWTDGLGNQDGNEAHVCQLDRIQKAVDHIFEKKDQKSHTSVPVGWWWLDTLCVPKGKTYVDEAKAAIANMKEIYLHAEGVLLVDSELCLCDDSMDALQVLSRLSLSNWVRRLWTFQEGLFAKDLYILVGSTPRSLADLVEETKAVAGDSFQERIVWDLLTALRPLFGPLKNVPTPRFLTSTVHEPKPMFGAWLWEIIVRNLLTWYWLFLGLFIMGDGNLMAQFRCRLTRDGVPISERTFSDVIRVVTRRKSTFAKDEALCLAFLLNLGSAEVKEIIKALPNTVGSPSDTLPSGPGMMKLMQLVSLAGRTFYRPGCIPPSIIFPIGPRLKTPGFRWLPESFISSVARRENYSEALPVQVQVPGIGAVTRPSGVVCEHGLRVMFPGLIISRTSNSESFEQFFLIDTAEAPPVRMSELEVTPKSWRCKFEVDEQGLSWADIAPKRGQSDNLAIIVGSFEQLGSGLAFNCILVKIKEQTSTGEYRVTRLGKIVGSSTPDFDDFKWLRQPWNRVEGRWLPLNQMWCVD